MVIICFLLAEIEVAKLKTSISSQVKDKNCIFTGYNFSSKETSWYFIGIYVYEVKQSLTK